MRSRSSEGRSKKRKGSLGPGDEVLDGYLDESGVDTADETALVAADDSTLLLYRFPRAIFVVASRMMPLLLRYVCWFFDH